MKIRSFIVAYSLVLAILLFADRRPGSLQQDRYSHVVDLTDGQDATAGRGAAVESKTRIIAPGSLIPGTWNAGQIPAERLVAQLVVIDMKPTGVANSKISLDDVAAWESTHGMIPQGAVVAVRRPNTPVSQPAAQAGQFPLDRDAAVFLMDARYSIGFAVETPVELTSDRTLARQIALHGTYVVEGASRLTSLPATGSLIIVAPVKNKKSGEVPARILAMVR